MNIRVQIYEYKYICSFPLFESVVSLNFYILQTFVCTLATDNDLVFKNITIKPFDQRFQKIDYLVFIKERIVKYTLDVVVSIKFEVLKN